MAVRPNLELPFSAAGRLRSLLDHRPLAPVVFETIWAIAMGFVLLIAATAAVRYAASSPSPVLILISGLLVLPLAVTALTLRALQRHLAAYDRHLRDLQLAALEVAERVPPGLRPVSVSELLEEARQVIAFTRGVAEYELVDAESTGTTSTRSKRVVTKDRP